MASIVFSFLLYSHIFFTPADQLSPAYSGEIATNYGPSCTSETRDGRVWMGHALSRFTRSSLIRGLPIISSATQNLTDADSVPSRHVRISRFQFSYVFQVNTGQKLIRLHFNPASYRGFRKHKDLFTVEADRFTLLGNFSASLTADALGLKYLVKEFCINVEKNQSLKLKFAPVHSLLRDTYAFVNGIDIIDLPAPLYYSHDGHLGALLIGHKHRVFIENSTALEMVHYLHFKESSVLQANSSGMLWSMATRKSNKINTFAWRIPVDVGFGYLVRLHLSELQIYMVDMEFSVLIDGKVADTKAESAQGRSHNSIHEYRDYMVMVNGHEQIEDRRDLVIAMKSKGGICDGPLTGFEILKLSNLDNSLASPKPSPPSQSSPFRSLKKFILHLVFGHGSAVAGVVASVITLANTIAYKMNKQRALTEGLHRFSLAEIRSATENFNSACFIGRGGYGKVYRGRIDDGQLKVAIKRLSSYSHQGAREFWTEVKALSKLRHANLVSLIGYCNESREMIIVYEFMPLGTLGDNLYKNAETDKSLSWEQRLRICIGAARGFDYLHTGTDHEVIHRDVKSSNILLDNEFKAKISDFGLAKIRECVELHSHVSTMVKGTPGYMDPAYRTSQQLTKKSDVYSFGVVLFEVLCGRKAVSSRDQENQPDLISWARGLIRDGHIDQIVDSRLNGQISPKCLKAFVDISEKCLHDDPKKRPTMVKLVAQLELLLEAHVRKTDAEMVQDLEAPAIVAQPNILEAPGGTRPNTRETSSNNSSSFGLWPREPSHRSKELVFPDGPCHCFSISDIVSATENFSSDNIIIHDGLYRIYRGSCYPPSNLLHTMYKGYYTPKILARNVAVARLNCAEEGMPDISTELEKLSYLDHSNLASMVGYCCSDGEMIIVYEHDGRGTLLQHLNRSDLSWKHKLNICIGAARALRYLHMGTGVKIIHGDISPSTIFLDDDWGTKVVNFGSILSNLNIRNAGELEHMPPDFADSTKLTEKSDVYLFGLLLLVVLCGKNAYYNYRLGRYPLHLPDKVREAIKKKNLHRITDLNPEVDIAEECLNEFLEVAFSCLRHKQVDRPSMDTVVEGLEGALSLQWVAETHINQQSYITSSY